MRKTILCLFITCITFTDYCFGQSLTSKESGRLQGIVYEFFSDQTWKEWPQIPEAFLCLLEIDSNGMVSRVHLLGSPGDKDSAFIGFAKMASSDFKNWKCHNCKGKTVVIPITLASSYNSSKHVADSIGLSAFAPGETQKLIIIRGVDFSWPGPVKHKFQNQ